MQAERFITEPSRVTIAPPSRIGIVCDFLEERWPSMDLVSDMLLESLHEEHSIRCRATRIRPAMRRRFSGKSWESGGPLSGGRIRFNVDRAIGRFWDYPRLLRGLRSEFDLFHVLDHSYGQLVHELPAERTVVTCHDLHTFRCLLDDASPRRSVPFRRMTERILRGMTSAARVVFPAAAVRDHAVDLGLVREEQSAVVPNGVHASCSPRGDESADAEAARLLALLPGSAIPLLHVGGTFGRKRLDLLLRIFAGVRRTRPEVSLVRVGGSFSNEQEQLARDLGVEDAIIVLPFLSREVLSAVYRRAALVLLPSEEEGFGLPVVEALACGTPVIGSDLAVLREVGGTCATFCSVGAVDQWVGSILDLLDERARFADRWEARRSAGLHHADAFSWREYGRRMVAIYEQVLGKAGYEISA